MFSEIIFCDVISASLETQDTVSALISEPLGLQRTAKAYIVAFFTLFNISINRRLMINGRGTFMRIDVHVCMFILFNYIFNTIPPLQCTVVV